MDGFQNIVLRGLDLDSVLLPVGILLAFVVVFFGLTVRHSSSSDHCDPFDGF